MNTVCTDFGNELVFAMRKKVAVKLIGFAFFFLLMLMLSMLLQCSFQEDKVPERVGVVEPKHDSEILTNGR